MEINALQFSIARVLRPLVRILLRYGVSHRDFNEVAKRVFAEVARDDFALPDKPQTKARIAVLTGIQRKEVSRLLALLPIEMDELDLQHNRGVRVTTGWRQDPDFLENGEPKALHATGPDGFVELVRRYSGDMPARAVLDELERVGSVERDENGMVTLVDDAGYVPRKDKEAQFNILGSAGRDLFSTIDHNLECQVDEQRLQLTVAYDNLPEDAVTRFRQRSREDCLELLKALDAWLSRHDRDSNPDVARTRTAGTDDRFRAGVGIYYFEEEIE